MESLLRKFYVICTGFSERPLTSYREGCAIPWVVQHLVAILIAASKPPFEHLLWF
jgi:hypothetical protein